MVFYITEIGESCRGNDQHSRIQSGGRPSVPFCCRPIGHYALIDKSVCPGGGNNPATKTLHLKPYSPRWPPTSTRHDRRLGCRHFAWTADGGRLVVQAKSFYFQDGGFALCLAVDELSAGWRLVQRDVYQEVPFSKVWSSRRFDLHCAFTLEREKRQVDNLICRLAAHQQGSTYRQSIRISLADLKMSGCQEKAIGSSFSIINSLASQIITLQIANVGMIS